jgi:signal transduction histidine kinase/CheY-like chemotaxis protein
MLIFLSLQFGFSYRAERTEVETTALERVGRIMGLVETALERSRASARVLTTIRSIDETNWAEADRRAREVMALNPDWKAVRLWDLNTGRKLVDTSGPLNTLIENGKRLPATFPAGADITLSGIDGRCLCMHLFAPVVRGSRVAYLFAIDLDSHAFQRLLIAAAPEGSVTAVVDRDGRFIARTLNYEQRVARFATHFVRDAIRRSDKGIYSGTTWEGLQNYTAFATSASTGWSTHMAVVSSAIDGPQWVWRLATLIAALVSTVLAFGLVRMGLRTIATERRTNERLQQAQRLEAIGKLTGGIAHDFNNMLAIITGSLDIAKRRLDSGNHDIGRYIDNAMEGSRRAADLTRRMLAFSKRQTLEPATLDVNALIEGMRDLLARTLNDDVRIECPLQSYVWPVHVDPGQLENALLNLAVNSRDAMPRGGTLTISTLNVLGRGDDSDRVRISVSDTGIGMSPEVKAKAFEPFFSTKDVGKGTGLGLSQIYGFVQQSGGTAEIESVPGAGTTVSILLPRATGPATPPRPRAATTAPGGSPEELILVVEDDDDVRSTNVEALRELGYTVLDTANPHAALDQIVGDPSIALLFTDIMMPDMDGRALAAAARKANPDLKILFTTGYERDDTADIEEGRILRKPYTFDRLARCVREALDET